MDENASLAEEYIKFEKAITPETTVDDFFDYCCIPMNQRSDFVFAAIMKQVKEEKRMQKIRKEVNTKVESLHESQGGV